MKCINLFTIHEWHGTALAWGGEGRVFGWSNEPDGWTEWDTIETETMMKIINKSTHRFTADTWLDNTIYYPHRRKINKTSNHVNSNHLKNEMANMSIEIDAKRQRTAMNPFWLMDKSRKHSFNLAHKHERIHYLLIPASLATVNICNIFSAFVKFHQHNEPTQTHTQTFKANERNKLR